MKKVLLSLAIIATLGAEAQTDSRFTWERTGNIELDSLMLETVKQWKYDDSLRDAGYKIKAANFGVEREVDEFTGEVRISTKIKFESAILYKYISKGVTVYYLSLEAEGSTVNYGTKGVTVLFRDGSKWTRPYEKVSLRYSSGFIYSAFIRISPAEVNLFSKKLIKAYRLYIYDSKLAIDEAGEFVGGVNRVKSLK